MSCMTYQIQCEHEKSIGQIATLHKYILEAVICKKTIV